MPTSRWSLVEEVVNLIETLPNHRRILDVGPGYGKYSVALRELLNVKPERIDAVEAVHEYVHAHRLMPLYEHVMVGDVCDLTDETLAGYDVVLMVDVIEHIEDEAAFGLIDRIPGRVVISTPVSWFQTDDGLPEPERHVSHWTEASWNRIGSGRVIESCVQSQGAWLVRVGPYRGH